MVRMVCEGYSDNSAPSTAYYRNFLLLTKIVWVGCQQEMVWMAANEILYQYLVVYYHDNIYHRVIHRVLAQKSKIVEVIVDICDVSNDGVLTCPQLISS